MTPSHCAWHPDKPAVAHGLCSTCNARLRRGKPLSDPARAPVGESVQLSIRASVTQLKAWQRAAKRAKQDFRHWIRAVLDRNAG